MYLFFDTETTGLPKNYNAPMSDVDNWPRIIQLAFIVVDKNGNEIDSYCELIKPDGWEVPDGEFWKDNGFTNELNKKKGVPISEALGKFIKAHDSCEVKIAHNLMFDYCVVGAEMIRSGMKCSKKNRSFCTKHETVDICKIESDKVTGKFKWPSLSELHFHLFGDDFEGAHDALADVRATAKCFLKIKKNGHPRIK